MNTILSQLITILEDNGGGLSTIRVLTMVWGAGAFLVWAIGSILNFYHGKVEFAPIPSEIITILLGVTGLKTVQRFGEKPVEEKKP